ncbi:MAG: hypothetical protein MUE42_09965 [Opitutaceae bacterium]|jgi:hypothetical protein|nr:hypothetical protein [Opitutaceae bacterium]
MPRPRRPACFALVLISGVALASPAEPAAGDTSEAGWRAASLYLFKESAQRFPEGSDREARLGRAALLLLQQPKTEANLAQAEAELEELASIAPASADEPGIAARYLLGRIAQMHRTKVDSDAAVAHYRRLRSEHPVHFLADQALVKLAQLEILAPGLSPRARLERVDAYAAEAEALVRAGSRRDLHLALAQACADFRLDDERALRHFLAADAAGIESALIRANVAVAIGELASRLGRPDLARIHFERYLAEFTRDYRRTLVRDKLAALAHSPDARRMP